MSRHYATQIYHKTIQNADCLDDPAKILAISPTVRHTVLKALVCASKYLGFYEEYQSKLKGYGIKWNNQDTAFNGFLSIFGKQHDTLGAWVKQVQTYLNDSERVLLRFLAVTGLRKNEAITAFNMLIDLNRRINLGNTIILNFVFWSITSTRFS